MTPGYARFREVRFFGSLDGLSALSIIGVIWFHSWWSTPYYSQLTMIPVLRQGEWGVDIFFAISGFLITTLLLRERQRSGTISIRDFYIRRSLRIWPLYYAVVAIYVVIMLFFETGCRTRSHLFPLSAGLPYLHIYLVHHSEVADGAIQPRVDAGNRRAVLCVLADRTPFLSRNLVLGSHHRGNRVAARPGLHLDESHPPSRFVAVQNCAQHRDSHLPRCALGPGSQL